MIKKTNRLEALVPGLKDLHLAQPESPWLSHFKETGVSRFDHLGLPTVKDEEWKYTNVLPISQSQFHFPTQYNIIEQTDVNAYLKDSKINLVFINGKFSEKLSTITDLPNNIHVLNISDRAIQEDKDILSLINHWDSANEDAFLSLNRALISDGIVIKIDDKVTFKELIHIVHITSGTEDHVLISPRTLIIVGKSSKAEVLESHISFSNISYFINAVTDISLAENAHLLYYKSQGESAKAYHIGTTRVWQERDSQFESFSFSTGGQLTRNNLTTVLNGEGASSVLDGLYAVTGNQHVDNHTVVDHRVAHCTSNQLYKGILDGNAQAVFNGKIFVKREAQQTNSYQLNKNLLLGKGCQVNTKPQLEIFADDVRCTHGATIGQLNEDELFYLQTRAVPKEVAVKMLCRGFVDDIFERISNSLVRQKMDSILTKAFSLLS